MSAAHRTVWHQRALAPVVAQLRQGITPEQIALTLALAAVLGIFPVLGATTILCAAAALLLRLNQPLIQAANYLLTPLHLALLLPFYRSGETLFGQAHVPIFSVGELVERFRAAPLQFFSDYAMLGLYGIVVWSLVAIPLTALLYLVLRCLTRRLATALARGRPASV